ncbi:hypothetical protein ACFQZC_05915 [Streptacidiphilus monticola]
MAAFAQPSASGTRVTVDKSLSAQLRALFQTYDRQAALDAQIRKLGGDPAQVSSAVAAAQVTVTTLRPADPLRSQRLAIAIAAGLLMYMSLMTVGQIVAQGWWRRRAAASSNCCCPRSSPGSCWRAR